MSLTKNNNTDDNLNCCDEKKDTGDEDTEKDDIDTGIEQIWEKLQNIEQHVKNLFVTLEHNKYIEQNEPTDDNLCPKLSDRSKNTSLLYGFNVVSEISPSNKKMANMLLSTKIIKNYKPDIVFYNDCLLSYMAFYKRRDSVGVGTKIISMDTITLSSIANIFLMMTFQQNKNYVYTTEIFSNVEYGLFGDTKNLVKVSEQAQSFAEPLNARYTQ